MSDLSFLPGQYLPTFSKMAQEFTNNANVLVYQRDGRYWLVHPEWKDHAYLGHDLLTTTRSLRNY